MPYFDLDHWFILLCIVQGLKQRKANPKDDLISFNLLQFKPGTFNMQNIFSATEP